jgi:hypothetical protein
VRAVLGVVVRRVPGRAVGEVVVVGWVVELEEA